LEIPLSDGHRRLLLAILERGAEDASHALSRWLGRPVRLEISSVEEVPLEEATEILGPGETLVASCAMALRGGLDGLLLLVFEDRSGLALVDMLLGQPAGTTETWGELEQSAAKETANIVGCAYLNSLAAHLPADAADRGQLAPGPPIFRHEFAASLLEFALMDQASVSDRLLLINSRFTAEAAELDWSLLFIPGSHSLGGLLSALGGRGTDTKDDDR
jgi:chemotaxis protein CheC